MTPQRETGTIEIRREEITSAVAGLLIGQLNAELLETYPEPGATHFRLDPDEVGPGRGVFLVAYEDGRPAGCGAVRRIENDAAELKRMYVAPHSVVAASPGSCSNALEAEARRLGASRLVLETGRRQDGALALYAQPDTRAPALWRVYRLPIERVPWKRASASGALRKRGRAGTVVSLPQAKRPPDLIVARSTRPTPTETLRDGSGRGTSSGGLPGQVVAGVAGDAARRLCARQWGQRPCSATSTAA